VTEAMFFEARRQGWSGPEISALSDRITQLPEVHLMFASQLTMEASSGCIPCGLTAGKNSRQGTKST